MNIAIEYRYAAGQREQLPELASELVRLKVDVIITIGGDVAAVLKKVTATIPIVMGTSADPVRAGLVSNLARPGGNITGLTFLSDKLAGKRLELLRETVPKISRVAVVWNPAHADNEFNKMQPAAQGLGIQLQSLEVRRLGELDIAFRAARRHHAEALIVVPSRVTNFLRGRIVDFAAKNRLPVVSGWRQFAVAGGLLTYGPDLFAGARRLSYFVDKILKGSKPSDLPVGRPTKFELVVNMKTAKQLGITIPPSILFRADKVIK